MKKAGGSKDAFIQLTMYIHTYVIFLPINHKTAIFFPNK